MNDRPSCSVIIPTMNMGPLLRMQLEALEGQDTTGFEVVVVDNGSTDDTADVVSSFRERLDLRYIRATARRGPPHPRNVGILTTSAPRLLFCDADDVVAPGWVRAHLDGLADAAITTGPVAGVTDAALRSGDLPRLFATSDFTSAPFEVGRGLRFASTCNAGFRREALEAIGGFAQANLLSDDVEASLQAQRLGHRLGFCPDARVLRRRRSGAPDSFRQSFDYAVGLTQLRREMAFTRDEVPTWVTPSNVLGTALRLPLLVSAARRPWVARRAGFIAGELSESYMPGRRFATLRRDFAALQRTAAAERDT